MNINQIVGKIDNIITKFGIPKYVKKWHKLSIPNNLFDYGKIIGFLYKYVQKYHHHSFVQSQKLITETSEENSQELLMRPMPNFSWNDQNKIGTIKFYHFINGYDQNENEQDTNKLINLVKKYIRTWTKNNLNGIAIDLTSHTGGNMWPTVNSLVDLLGNTTLFSWNNQKTKFTDKKWCNQIDGQVKFNQKFLTNALDFDRPIAIIVSNETASSGEFIASIFYGRSNVKIFGDNTNRTAGQLSVNQGFKINKDITLYIPVKLETTVDGVFQDQEYLTVDVNSKYPFDDAADWILDH